MTDVQEISDGCATVIALWALCGLAAHAYGMWLGKISWWLFFDGIIAGPFTWIPVLFAR